jgi:hypothetical protein
VSDLIKALQILLKYGDPDRPTHCGHDVLTICGISAKDVSADDIAELDKLGFFISEEFEDADTFISFRFGSA